MKRRSLLLGFFAALLAFAPAWAGERPFDKTAFEKALAEGKPVIVDFYADWCPTCKAQKPHALSVLGEPRMKDVILFVADFDKERDLRRSLRVTQQSTFVVFKAGKEVARSTGQTRREDLAALFAKAL